MKCQLCGVNKLIREFPRETITHECDHPPICCLRCTVDRAKTTGKCPFKGCKAAGDAIKPERLQELEMQLDFLFPLLQLTPVVESSVAESHTSDGGTDQTIHVAMLTGDKQPFQIRPMSTTVAEFKMMIRDRLGVEVNKQRLVHDGKQIESYKPNGAAYKLNDFGIKSNSVVHLMILLYAVPDKLNHIIFDLCWEYPASGRDFLDASCLMFMKNEWYSFVDWREREDGGFIRHSGDNMDDMRRVGRHRIEVKLRKISKCVSHLVFVLSSFRAPSIGHFPKPSLRLYDAADTSKDLVETTYTHELTSQALIVGCLSRTTEDNWEIFTGGQQSEGNAMAYGTLLDTIKELIDSNHFPGESLEPGVSRVRDMTESEAISFFGRCKRR